MHIGGALLLVALCMGADGDSPVPSPLALPAATEQALPTPTAPPPARPQPSAPPDAAITPAGGVVSGTTPPAVVGTALGSTALLSAEPVANRKMVWGVVDAKLFPDA